MTVNVVGAGLAGSIITRLLRAEGFNVRVFDDGDKFSASQASSNLFVASWLSKFKSEDAATGIRVLERLFPKEIDQPFASGIVSALQVRHVAQRYVLVPTSHARGVRSVVNEGLVDIKGDQWGGPTIICTGYRGAELVPGLKIDVKVGHALFIEGQLKPGQSCLSLVSPYVHQKLYQFDEDTIYFADSVAVPLDRYDMEEDGLLFRTRKRARKALGYEPKIKKVLVGYRPIVKGSDFGLCIEPQPGVFVLNGGGKNGMVAYAAQADKIVSRLKGEISCLK